MRVIGVPAHTATQSRCVRNLRKAARVRPRRMALAGIVFLAMIFVPSALGLGAFAVSVPTAYNRFTALLVSCAFIVVLAVVLMPVFTPRAWRWARHNRLGASGVVFIVGFYLFGILAQWIAPYDPFVQNLYRTNEGVSGDYWFGTDRLGRDLLSRSLFALRTTVAVTAATLLVGAGMLGVFLGLVGGYFRGRFDRWVNEFGQTAAMLPGLMIAIIITATIRDRYDEFMRGAMEWSPLIWAAGDGTVVLAALCVFALVVGFVSRRRGLRFLPYFSFGIAGLSAGMVVGLWLLNVAGFKDLLLIFVVFLPLSWYGTYRLIRSVTLSLREREFVLAAKAQGATSWWIIQRHLFPNVLGLVLVGISAGFGFIAGSEIALTYLGLGVQPPNPSFGALISDAGSIRTLQVTPLLLLVPAVIVTMLIYSWVLLGDALGARASFTQRMR